MSPPFFLTVYRFTSGGQAEVVSRVTLDIPKADAWEALIAARSGLPSDCGAGLTDRRGYNVRPTDKESAA